MPLKIRQTKQKKTIEEKETKETQPQKEGKKRGRHRNASYIDINHRKRTNKVNSKCYMNYQKAFIVYLLLLSGYKVEIKRPYCEGKKMLENLMIISVTDYYNNEYFQLKAIKDYLEEERKKKGTKKKNRELRRVLETNERMKRFIEFSANNQLIWILRNTKRCFFDEFETYVKKKSSIEGMPERETIIKANINTLDDQKIMNEKEILDFGEIVYGYLEAKSKDEEKENIILDPNTFMDKILSQMRNVSQRKEQDQLNTNN